MSGGHSLGVQLYTVRDAARADLSETLRRIAEIGYPVVEPHDILSDPDRLRRLLTEHRLSAPTAHAPVLGERQAEVLTAATTVGAGTVIAPYLPPERFATAEDVAEVATLLNRASERAGAHGLRVGYHNHHFELQQRIDGAPALERLAALLDPEVVLEVDVYWAAVGEPDVVGLLRRLGERVRLVHIKDGPMDLESAHVAVGDGRMPIRAVLDAVEALEIGIVELDHCDGNVFTALTRSFDYLTSERTA